MTCPICSWDVSPFVDDLYVHIKAEHDNNAMALALSRYAAWITKSKEEIKTKVGEYQLMLDEFSNADSMEEMIAIRKRIHNLRQEGHDSP